MGAEDVALTAILIRTSSGDELRFSDGQMLKLTNPLSWPQGQEMIIAVMEKHHYQLRKQELAKQLLLEIVNR